MSYEKIFDYYDQCGVYAYYGPDRNADTNKLCYMFGEKNPECTRSRNPIGFG